MTDPARKQLAVTGSMTRAMSRVVTPEAGRRRVAFNFLQHLPRPHIGIGTDAPDLEGFFEETFGVRLPGSAGLAASGDCRDGNSCEKGEGCDEQTRER